MAQFVGLSIAPLHDTPGPPKNDLHLDAAGNLALVQDGEAIGQHVRQQLMFWRGEWFLNEDAGVDWKRYVLGRPPSEIAIAEAVFKREVLNTPGVAEILELDVRHDRASRGFIVERCTIETIDGEIVELSGFSAGFDEGFC